jgi:hypothetical protein
MSAYQLRSSVIKNAHETKHSQMKSPKAFATFLLAGSFVAILTTAAIKRVRDEPAKSAADLGLSVSIFEERRSFSERCAGHGVLVCEGFDKPGDFVPARWPSSGLYPGGCPTCDFQDTSIKASGKSSYRMEIPGKSGERPAGNWVQHFGKAFGPGSTFYVQFAFRADSNWLMNWNTIVGSYPKLSIFHNSTAGTCAIEDIVTSNLRAGGAPTMYGECGVTSFSTHLDGLTPDPKTNTPYLIQQGFTDPPPTTGYACHNYDPKPGPPFTGNCFYFHANNWYTLYWIIHVGNWGQPNSSVEGYVGSTGGQLKKFINAINWTLNSNSPPDSGFDTVTLTQFMTNAMPTAHPTAYVWYDDLVVSTEPIPPPTAPL